MSLLGSEALPELAPESVGMLKVALGIYVAVLFAVSIVASRKVKNEEDYLVAGRSLPLWLAWGTLMATWFGAATMFGAAEASRAEGLQGVILDPFACASTLIFAGLFFARPLWKMQLFTICDFYREKYGPRAEIIGSSIQVPSYFAWIALQYTALSGILHTYFDVDRETGIYIAAALTMVYTMVGGMWSVTLTDTLQILVALVGLVVLTIAVFKQPLLGDGSVTRGVSVLVEKLNSNPDHANHLNFFPSWDAIMIMGWIGAWATGLFGCIPGQDLQQRVFASKDEKTASRACILAGCLYLVFGILPVTIGMASLITHPELKGEPVAVLAAAFLSPLWLVVFIIAVVSMVVSTATSAVLAPATLLGHNLLSRLNIFGERKLLRDRLCVVIVTGGGVVLALQGKKMMGLLDIALSIQLVSMFIPVAFGIYGKPKGELSAVLPMCFGFSAWLIRFVFDQESVASALGDSLTTGLAGKLMVVPADFYGFGFALAGYFLGQWLSSRAATDAATT